MEEKRDRSENRACDTNEKLQSETTIDRKGADVENKTFLCVFSMFVSLSVFFGCLSD